MFGLTRLLECSLAGRIVRTIGRLIVVRPFQTPLTVQQTIRKKI